MEIHPNEIRDFVNRAPRPFVFEGQRILDMSRVRGTWLSEMASGSIDDRINRRAGIKKTKLFYKTNTIFASVRRNHRNEMRKIGIRICY